jgi:hypothetical protein
MKLSSFSKHILPFKWKASGLFVIDQVLEALRINSMTGIRACNFYFISFGASSFFEQMLYYINSRAYHRLQVVHDFRNQKTFIIYVPQNFPVIIFLIADMLILSVM